MASKTKWLAITGLAIIMAAGCFQEMPAASTSNPQPVATRTLPWAEDHGLFYTRDLARAQQQIPFDIVVPGYLPGTLASLPPNIRGPLKGYQHDGEVELEMLWYVPTRGEVPPPNVQIWERNYPLLPPPPELNPTHVYTEVRGKRMVKTEGDLQLGRGVIYYFNRGNIYFQVGVYGFPPEEAVKIVESMLE